MPSTKASSGARGVAGPCPIISVYYAYLLRSHGIRHLHCRQNVIALWQTADSISRSADAHAVAHTPFRWPGRRTKMRFMRTAYARPRTEMHGRPLRLLAGLAGAGSGVHRSSSGDVRSVSLQPPRGSISSRYRWSPPSCPCFSSSCTIGTRLRTRSSPGWSRQRRQRCHLR